jgi:hypothetical protein
MEVIKEVHNFAHEHSDDSEEHKGPAKRKKLNDSNKKVDKPRVTRGNS